MPDETDIATPEAAPQPAVETTPAPPSGATTPPAGATPAEPTVESIVADVLKQHDAEPQPATEKEEEPSGAVETLNKTEEKPLGQEEPSKGVEADKGPVPYTRFEEINAKFKTATEELERQRPAAVEAARVQELLASNGISPAEYQDALDTLVLLKRDPKAGLERLKPLIQSLSQYDEGYVPPELQSKLSKLATRVEEGEISQAAADELKNAWTSQARYEAQQRLGQHQGQMTEQQRQQAHLQSITSAASSWDAAKQKGDPDYKPKTKAEDPDGVFELTRKGFMYEIANTPVKDPATCVQLLEKAYKDAKHLFTTRLKPAATKPAPNANRSSTTPRKEPESELDVVNEVLRQHGIPALSAPTA